MYVLDIYIYMLINEINNNYFLQLEISCLTLNICLMNVKHETSSCKK